SSWGFSVCFTACTFTRLHVGTAARRHYLPELLVVLRHVYTAPSPSRNGPAMVNTRQITIAATAGSTTPDPAASTRDASTTASTTPAPCIGKSVRVYANRTATATCGTVTS